MYVEHYGNFFTGTFTFSKKTRHLIRWNLHAADKFFQK